MRTMDLAVTATVSSLGRHIFSIKNSLIQDLYSITLLLFLLLSNSDGISVDSYCVGKNK
jgi:hypothetical protein